MIDFKKIFLTFIIALTTSCESNLHRLAQFENNLRLDNFYSSYLALEYLEYSRSLAMAGNWHDSEYFADKGITSSRGYKITPESPIKWGVPMKDREDAIMAQKRLEQVSIYEMRKALPIQTAHLFFLYDCWISKDSKPAFRDGELVKCKDRFYKLLDETEDYLNNLRNDSKPRTIIIEPEFERFEIYFDHDYFTLNDLANKTLIDVLKYIATLNGNYRVILVGQADRSGHLLYNDNLAFKRVEIIRKFLSKNGVADDIIDERAVGENFPDIITQKGMQHQLNRSVEIYVVKGGGSNSALDALPSIVNRAYKKEILRARKTRGYSN